MPARLRTLLRVLTIMALALGFTGVAVTAAQAPALAASHNCGEPPVQYILNDGPGDIFSAACARHDVCYYGGSQGRPFMGNRAQCDGTFYSMMWAACDAHASGLGWAACWTQATAYYSGVRQFGWLYWWGNWWDNV